MATAEPEKKPRRRWLRFSTRTLLVVTAILAIWLGIHTERVHRQRRAVKAVLELGGSVVYAWGAVDYDYSLTVGPPLLMDDLGETVEAPGPRWLRKILGDDFFAHVSQVDLDLGTAGSTETATLEFLSGLPDLESLILSAWGDEVNANGFHWPALSLDDVALRRIGRLSKLRRLTIEQIGASPAGLAELRRLRRLEELQITAPPVMARDEWAFLTSLEKLQDLELHLPPDASADDAVRYLGRLRDLKSLSLPGLLITKERAALLRGMENLTVLDLNGASLTEGALEEIGRHPTLVWLSLANTNVRGPGLARLAEVSQLHFLALPETVDANDLESLATLPAKREVALTVFVSQRKVNGNDVHRLEKKIANLEIVAE